MPEAQVAIYRLGGPSRERLVAVMLDRPTFKENDMAEISEFMDSLVEEIKVAPKLFHQFELLQSEVEKLTGIILLFDNYCRINDIDMEQFLKS